MSDSQLPAPLVPPSPPSPQARIGQPATPSACHSTPDTAITDDAAKADPLLPLDEPPEEPGVTQVEDAQLTTGERVKQSTAFALSALLSPYLVLPVGTAGIIGSVTQPRKEFFFYTALSIFFSTILPALFVIFEVWRGRITDVHIMDRAQRGGPFLVAILSSALGAGVLRYVGAPADVWGISAVLALNGVLLTLITSFWKISMHVAVLSATVCAALLMIPQDTPWPLLALIPALIWGRVTRGRHTVWQGLAGAMVAALITGGGCLALRYWYTKAAQPPSATARPRPKAAPATAAPQDPTLNSLGTRITPRP
jgi:hypothetical protein